MKYAKLGDIEIPAIALGTWSWGTGINGGNQILEIAMERKILSRFLS